MSYVLARDIGCSFPASPWEYYPQGPDTLFSFPQNPSVIAGKTGNASVNSTTDVGQSFYAFQVFRGGWAPGGATEADRWYHKMYTQSYPAAFLPCCWNPGPYVNGSGSASFYNLGQIFLNNAFTFVFCDWNRSDIAMELTNRNAPGSHETPIFTNPAAWPTRARLVQHLLRGSKDPKYGGLIHHVLSQAKAANDGIGPCRKALLFVCGELSRKENNNPAWHNSELGQWFRGYAKTRGIPMGPGPVNVPINFCGACCQTPLTPRMGGFGSPVVHR